MQLSQLNKLLVFALLLGASSSMPAQADAIPDTNQADPYENFNRGTYEFNKGFDKVILKPVACFYKKLLPWPVTKGVSNFFSNLNTVPTVINDVLQGNGHCAVHDTTRLIINSTVGVGGLIDVAAHRDLPKHCNDFGLTLAKWGYKCSNYIVLPFLGPATFRDTVALPVDYFAFSPYPYLFPDLSTRVALLGLYIVDQRSQLLAFEGVMKEAAIDEYVFQRNAFLQHRNTLIACNNPNYKMSGNPAEKMGGGANDAYVPSQTETTVTKTTVEDNYLPGGADHPLNKPNVNSNKNAGTAEENYVPGGGN